MPTKCVEAERGLFDPAEGIGVSLKDSEQTCEFPRGQMTDDQVERRAEDSGADVYFEPRLFPGEVWGYKLAYNYQ